jgi:hypothetical protein
MKTFIILLVLFSSSLIYSQDDRWVFVCSSRDKTTDYYYDSQSIQYVDNSVIVWEKTIINCIKSSENPKNDSLYNKLKNTPVKDLTDSDWKYLQQKDDMWSNYILHKRKYYCGQRKQELLYRKDVFMDMSYKSEDISLIRDIIPETVSELFYLTFCNK